VERAQPDELLAAGLERQVLTDQLDEVGRLLDLDFGVVVQGAFPMGPLGRADTSNRATAVLGWLRDSRCAAAPVVKNLRSGVASV